MRPGGRAVVLCASLVVGLAHIAFAQGVTTGVIRGTVTDPSGGSIDNANALVHNAAKGVRTEARIVRGRLLAQGLELGGPYFVEIRHIGFAPVRVGPLHLSLGEPIDLRLVLQPLAIALDTVVVAAGVNRVSSASLVSDSLVRRLPTPNRNFYDFIILVPQISTKVGLGRSGVSAAGANMRFNSFLINGVEERAVNGSISAAQNVGKSVPIDAVKEYSVLVAPFDVRYGDFAGALVNTVTRSGTNKMETSAFAQWRSNQLRRADDSDSENYDRMQYGFAASGPLVRDRLHFIVAGEAQRATEYAAGPYIGQPQSSANPIPVDESDITRLQTILSRYGLAAGSGGRVRTGTTLSNAFGRIDAALPRWNSRAIAFFSTSNRDDDSFSRTARDTFSLSSYAGSSRVEGHLVSVQLHSGLRGNGGHNELTISQLSEWIGQGPDRPQPLVRVRVSGLAGPPVTINAGTNDGIGRTSRNRSLRVRDELSLPLGARHLLTMGGQAEHFRILRSGINGGYGVWTFASLDDLERGAAERFDLRRDFGTASYPFSGWHLSLFAGDEWKVGDRLTLTAGIRADRVTLEDRAPRNPEIDSIFGRRTDRVPRARIHFSPRLGFRTRFSDDDQLRGGIGVFTGRPPLAWFVPARSNHGEAIGVLACGSLVSDRGSPPAFVPDYRSPPTQCATGAPVEAKPFGDVDMLDPDLRLAQSMRGAIAYERRLPWALTMTSEFVATKYFSDFIWANLNLEGPQGEDRNGRVMYGTISGNGVSQPKLRSQYSQVMDLQNTSRNYSYQLSTRMERRFDNRIAANLGYTYSRVRDVQSLSRVNLTGLTLWADARAISGRHEVQELGVSLNDIPHRFVAAVSYSAPWRRWSTDLSLYYVAESGSPFTYVATGSAGRGDLNADGSNTNDPIYVPRNVLDTSEVRFVSASDATAFDDFISRTDCLNSQRGRILTRNSCREPWSHTTVASVRQSVPLRRGSFEAEINAFNLLNLANRKWGTVRIASPRLLTHVAQTSTASQVPQSIFRFDPERPDWTVVPGESVFQLQVSGRYRF